MNPSSLDELFDIKASNGVEATDTVSAGELRGTQLLIQYLLGNSEVHCLPLATAFPVVTDSDSIQCGN